MTAKTINQKGLTLIEILVVVVILGIVAGLAATSNLKGGADTAALNAQTKQLISDLRLLQTQASATQASTSLTIVDGGKAYETKNNKETSKVELERGVTISGAGVTFNSDGTRSGSAEYITLELSANGEQKRVKISQQGLVEAD